MNGRPAFQNICWQASPNHGPRKCGPIDMLLLHYTGMHTPQVACRWLCNPDSKVSAHYLVDEAGAVTQMVGEDRRAWHAGLAFWDGETDINSRSIGIEIHNLGPDSETPAFPEVQIKAVIDVCKGILSRHPIPGHRVLAHSDVSPGRKTDPGPYFPWATLAAAGVGIWPEPMPPQGDEGLGLDDEGLEILALQQKLGAAGYDVELSGIYDQQTQTVVTAFQLHFRPGQANGLADISTLKGLDDWLKATGRSPLGSITF